MAFYYTKSFFSALAGRLIEMMEGCKPMQEKKLLKDMCYIFFYLKLNGINLVSFKLQRQQCSTAGNDFLFKERQGEKVEKFVTYEHNNSEMYLTCSCDIKARLTLIRSSNRREDRKIRFFKKSI